MDIIKLIPVLSGTFLTADIVINDKELTSSGNVPDLFNIKRPLLITGDTDEHPVFNCSCGIYECGGINMQISSTEDNIIWRMKKPQKFSYIFDKEQYKKAFEEFQAGASYLIKDREDLQKNKFFISLLKPFKEVQ